MKTFLLFFISVCSLHDVLGQGTCVDLYQNWNDTKWTYSTRQGYTWQDTYTTSTATLQRTVDTSSQGLVTYAEQSCKDYLFEANKTSAGYTACFTSYKGTIKYASKVQWTDTLNSLISASSTKGTYYTNYDACLGGLEADVASILLNPKSNPAPVNCGILDGTYHLQYVDAAGIVYCSDDSASTGTVAGSSIDTTSSCFTAANAYKEPFKKRFVCMDRYPQSFMGATNTGGDILLLKDTTQPTGMGHYCARVTMENKVINLTLNVEDADYIQCYPDTTTTAVINFHVKLVLTPIVASPTTVGVTTAATTVQSTAAPPDCGFPTSYTTHLKFMGYRNNEEAVKNYTLTDYTVLLKDVGTTYSFECEDTESVDDTQLYYTIQSNAGEECFYEKYIPDKNLQFHRQTTARPSFTIEECKAAAAAEATFSMYLDMPLESTFPGVQCPIPDSIYQLTYSESSSVKDQCVGDDQSILSVSGSSMTIKACGQNSASFRQPYDTTLHCISTLNATTIGATSADGDFLLLSDSLPLTGKPRFYIVRYLMQGGKVYLSFDVLSQDDIMGSTSRDAKYYADSNEEKFRAFILSPVATTAAPVATTAAPVATTAAPVASTAAPVATTAAPVATTAAPVATTAAPVATTAAPVATTAAPVATTAAPVATTAAPVATTAAPVATTAAPVATTAAPVATTAAPVATTAAPVATTAAPVATTAAPVATTAAPVATTAAPVATTAAPVATTAAPVATTAAPVATTAAPVASTAAPVASTAAPVATTAAPVATTAAPVATTAAPVATTAAPVATTAAPVASTASPVATTAAQNMTGPSGPSTTAPLPATTAVTSLAESTAATEAGYHVTVTFNGQYDQVIGNNQVVLQDNAKAVLENVTNSTQIDNVELTKGSVLLDFDILSGTVSVSSALDSVRQAVIDGTLRLPLLDGSFLTPDSASFTHFNIPPGGPCAVKPCQNSGSCADRTISLFTCTCQAGYSGATCSVVDEGGAGDNFELIIAICVVGAVIVIITILALIVCSWRKDRSPPRRKLSDDEGNILIAKTWTVSYGNNTFPTSTDSNNFTNGGFSGYGFYK